MILFFLDQHMVSAAEQGALGLAKQEKLSGGASLAKCAAARRKEQQVLNSTATSEGMNLILEDGPIGAGRLGWPASSPASASQGVHRAEWMNSTFTIPATLSYLVLFIHHAVHSSTVQGLHDE